MLQGYTSNCLGLWVGLGLGLGLGLFSRVVLPPLCVVLPPQKCYLALFGCLAPICVLSKCCRALARCCLAHIVCCRALTCCCLALCVVLPTSDRGIFCLRFLLLWANFLKVAGVIVFDVYF